MVASADPSLADTVAFMNRVLEDDGAGAIRTAGNCELLLVRYHLGNVTLPDGTIKSPGDYDKGVPDRYEYTWSIVDPSFHLDSDFNLKDIDPNSIKVNEAWSVEVIASREDKFNPHLPSKDRSLIMFGTSNLVKVIQQTNFVDHVAVANAHETGAGDISFLLQPGTTDRLTKYASTDVFLISHIQQRPRCQVRQGVQTRRGVVRWEAVCVLREKPQANGPVPSMHLATSSRSIRYVWEVQSFAVGRHCRDELASAAARRSQSVRIHRVHSASGSIGDAIRLATAPYML